MEDFTITSSQLNSTFDYKNDSIIVQGNFSQNAEDNTLQNISGTAYAKDAQGNQGEYIGNFNGYMRENGELRYSLSEMTRQQSNKVWAAIEAIEANIINEE